MIENPKISIITVVRNGERYIEQTINSILSQSYGNIEYIIIDGQSKDDTLNIIKKYDSQIAFWTSAEDTGIYDAMNKGVNAATGDWLLFINSDDFLIDSNAISNALPYLQSSKHWVVYGMMTYVLPNGGEIIVGDYWENIKNQFRRQPMVGISHQSTFHSKLLFENNRYNTQYKLAGDYELLHRYLKDNDASYMPVKISKMRNGGQSTLNYVRLFHENCNVFLQDKDYMFFLSGYFINYAISTYGHFVSNKIFGPNLVKRLKSKIKIH